MEQISAHFRDVMSGTYFYRSTLNLKTMQSATHTHLFGLVGKIMVLSVSGCYLKSWFNVLNGCHQR